MLYSAAATSFLEREPAGIGLAKAEAAAKAKRVAKTRMNCIVDVVEDLFGETRDEASDTK